MAKQGYHRRESRTSPRRLETKELSRKALELRKAGANFTQIQKELGYKSLQSAINAVDRALRMTMQPAADEVRKIELERLDMMLLTLLPKIRIGDTDAINTALRIMDRRAKYLGLDMPIKAEITGKDGKPIQYDVRSIQIDTDKLVEAIRILTNAGAARLGDGDQPLPALDEVHPDNANT